LQLRRIALAPPLRKNKKHKSKEDVGSLNLKEMGPQ
jgi:hypothetical protein